MLSLIEALQIFLKYGDPPRPTHCEHDVLAVCIDPSVVMIEDLERLDKLGFFPDEDDRYFESFRFGSA